jgi:hypothetical protein
MVKLDGWPVRDIEQVAEVPETVAVQESERWSVSFADVAPWKFESMSVTDAVEPETAPEIVAPEPHVSATEVAEGAGGSMSTVSVCPVVATFETPDE